MSTEDWYRMIEATRKKNQDHPWVNAVVKGINPGAGEMTISPGPIPHAKMPAMTMTFPVRDPADLTAHEVGHHVLVQVAEDGGIIRLPWWRTDEKAEVVFFARLGWKPIEFEKVKAGVIAGSMVRLPAVIDVLIGAVRAGEVDSMLEQARTARPAPKKKAA
jgi:Cu/Ag efflux protein CusF